MLLQSKKANFDATHELEELLLEDNPLKARKRNPNLDISQMSVDMRQMEESFTTYDHSKMVRKSHFRDKVGEKEHGQTSTITTTSAIALEDQPLAEMQTLYAGSHHEAEPHDSPSRSARPSFDRRRSTAPPDGSIQPAEPMHSPSRTHLDPLRQQHDRREEPSSSPRAY
jgi:hypothetical protein